MTHLEGLKNWFIKYKLYHIPFWFGYHLIWLTINIGSFSEVNDYLFFSVVSIKFYFYVIFQMIGVYFNLYYLIPKFLYVGKNKIYVLLVLFTILMCAAFVTSGYYVVASASERTFFELFNLKPNQFLSIFLIQALPSTAASMTLAMSVKLGKNWLKSEKKRLHLEKENLETELKYLKSQFNPHFLFNTINSIFVLIHKNSDMASESLAKFSDLLRYQLYECNEPQIPLEKEIAYIHGFIELEELRQNENFELQTDITNTKLANLGIAPFILMPFIENAFKHVSKFNKDIKNWIKIEISFKENQMIFKIANSISENVITSGEIVEYNGLGLKNVERRLNLLYPDEHSIEIIKSDTTYEVTLLLNLKEYKKVKPVIND